MKQGLHGTHRARLDDDSKGKKMHRHPTHKTSPLHAATFLESVIVHLSEWAITRQEYQKRPRQTDEKLTKRMKANRRARFHCFTRKSEIGKFSPVIQSEASSLLCKPEWIGGRIVILS